MNACYSPPQNIIQTSQHCAISSLKYFAQNKINTQMIRLYCKLFVMCASAGLHALRRALGSTPGLSDVQVINRVKVTTFDLRLAMTQVKPSAMREVAIDVPKVLQ